MRKIILDFFDVLLELPSGGDGSTVKGLPVILADAPENKIKDYKELIHDYIAENLGFPDYYGKNLDALYDCLTDIDEPTAIGFFIPVPDDDETAIDFMMYLERVRKVFLDAERDNPDYLAVISADDSGVFSDDEDPDEELEKLLGQYAGEFC